MASRNLKYKVVSVSGTRARFGANAEDGGGWCRGAQMGLGL